MAYAILSYPVFQAFDDDGTQLVGGFLYSYAQGTSTAKALYQDKDLLTAHANPITLNSRGEATIWGSGQYKLILQDADATQIWSVDGVDLTNISNFSRSLLILNTAADWRTALGLGTAATKDVGTSAGNVVQLDANAKLPAVDGSQLTGLTTSQLTDWEDPTIEPVLPRGYIDGLIVSRASATTITVSAGQCRDGTNAENMVLDSAITKDLTQTWAVGTGNGGFEVGSSNAANTWFYIYVIKRTDTDVVDVIISDDTSAPTYPTSYTLSRRVGCFQTDSSSEIINFTQVGNSFYWNTINSVNDVITGSSNTSADVDLSGNSGIPPINCNLIASIDATKSGTIPNRTIYVRSSFNSGTTGRRLGTTGAYQTSSTFGFPHIEIYVPGDQQITYLLNGAPGTGDSLTFNTYIIGFIDRRGKDA